MLRSSISERAWILAFGLAVEVMLGDPAAAVPIAVPNGGFEKPALADGTVSVALGAGTSAMLIPMFVPTIGSPDSTVPVNTTGRPSTSSSSAGWTQWNPRWRAP